MSIDPPSLLLGLAGGGALGALVGFLLARRVPAEPSAVVETEKPVEAIRRPVPILHAPAPAEVEAFDAALEEAAAAGWPPALPDGRRLSRQLGGTDADARKAARALEVAARRGLLTRDDVFARQLAVDRVWRAAARLAAVHGLELRIEAPRAVGPRHQEHWIIDEDLARRFGVKMPGGFVQPVLVVRPALVRGDHVLLEGVVV